MYRKYILTFSNLFYHIPCTPMKKKTVVITGGTDGIGAATALEYCRRGANVIIIGRSHVKADEIVRRANKFSSAGTIEVLISDFSIMKNVKNTVQRLREKVSSIDVIIHAVGILISKTEHTTEGIEKDFAVSYLSRFVFMEEASAHNLLTEQTIMLNIAASAPKIPRYAQMEFHDIAEVRSRVGMKSHGQAQLANDIFTGLAAHRYGITTIGYGPGSVNTNIRRELPKILVALIQPFFAFSTREPFEVARQIVGIVEDKSRLMVGQVHYCNKNGSFPADPFITDTQRKQALLKTSLTLVHDALSGSTHSAIELH